MAPSGDPTQSPLNSRRFSNRILTPYTMASPAPIVAGREVVQLSSTGTRRIGRLRLLAGADGGAKFWERGELVGVPRYSRSRVPTCFQRVRRCPLSGVKRTSHGT